MTEILKDKVSKTPVKPVDIVGMNVCNLSGMAVPEEGCESHFEYFKKDFLPQKTIFKQSVLINKDTGLIVKEGEDIPNAEWQEHTIVKDIVGTVMCLDCTPVGVGSSEVKPTYIK